MYFDAHTHLQQIDVLDTAMKRAFNRGVRYFLCNATNEQDWDKVIDISKQYKGVYVALGVHPWYIDTLSKDWDKRLEQKLVENKNILIGEIGIDKLRPDMDRQEKILRIQLELAWKYQRPAVIHCVRAWDRLLHIFKTQRQKMPPKILSHSHHGNADLIPQMIEKYNAYFSYSSIFAPENHPKVRACLKATPLDRLMIESDCPDLTEEPAVIPDLVHKMAEITGHNEKKLKQALLKNAKEFVKC